MFGGRGQPVLVEAGYCAATQTAGCPRPCFNTAQSLGATWAHPHPRWGGDSSAGSSRKIKGRVWLQSHHMAQRQEALRVRHRASPASKNCPSIITKIKEELPRPHMTKAMTIAIEGAQISSVAVKANAKNTIP